MSRSHYNLLVPCAVSSKQSRQSTSGMCTVGKSTFKFSGKPFMLSIRSPYNAFMVLVSTFISNSNHFCVLCFRLAAARATTTLLRTEILNTIR